MDNIWCTKMSYLTHQETKNMKSLSKYIAVIVIGFASVFAGTTDPSVPDSKYLEYGTHFKYVGKLCGECKDGSLFCASAVVIKENIILTAAHVVEDYKKCTITVEDKEYKVERFIWPKQYEEKQYGYGDIAIGFVSEPIKLDFYPELYDKEDEVDKVCCIAGYGITGTFNTGAIKSDTKRRAGSNIIEEIDRKLLVCRASRPYDKRRTSLEFIIASGDSGGGLFIDSKLAGINSCITGSAPDSMKSRYNTDSCHTRVSEYRRWILDSIE